MQFSSPGDGEGGDGALGHALRGAAPAGALSQHVSQPPLVWLIVDDVSSNALFLRRMLSRRHPADAFLDASDGAQAVALVRSGAHVDVVLMDKEMPVMDGHEATRALRAGGFRGLVFGCTGNAQPADRAAFLAAGADDVFFKPLDVGAIDAAVAGAAARGGVAQVAVAVDVTVAAAAGGAGRDEAGGGEGAGRDV